MVNGAFKPGFASDDLGLERDDAFLKLLDRQRIEVLDRQLAEQIVLATRQIFIGFHHVEQR